ncbi:MAG TPA: GNAT family protein [Beijerinckiaceae bacterium]|jgi:RimJ/RimL family protein N-acetyltransferase
MMEVRPVTLATSRVRLRPLATDDAPALAEAVRDGELWTLPTTFVPRPADMQAAIARLLEQQRAGAVMPFVLEVLDDENGAQVVGATSYMTIVPEHRRLAIGGTWIARSWQRSFVNSHAKALLLAQAFDVLSCNTVQFTADVLDFAAQDAIERLGARQDGVLRGHMVMRDGRVRDTAVYSLLKAEWPMARSRLARSLGPDLELLPQASLPRPACLPALA